MENMYNGLKAPNWVLMNSQKFGLHWVSVVRAYRHSVSLCDVNNIYTCFIFFSGYELSIDCNLGWCH